MSEKFADLHLHTTASDGTQDIRTLVARAAAVGLSSIAITDHDTISEELTERVTRISGMEVITGVELKVDYDGVPGEILGYFIDPLSEPMVKLFQFMRTARQERMEEMVNRCRERVGIDVSLEEVRALAAGSIGRPHLAKILVDKGAVKTMREAFDKLIGSDGACYVRLDRPRFRDANDAIHAADGVTSVPHPCFIASDDWDAFSDKLLAARVDGIESFYPYAEGDSRLHIAPEEVRKLAERKGFLLTGGSDDHGPNSVKEKLGAIQLPYRYVEAMKVRCNLA
ncbi:MAG TPA: PHP domain-containing protein [Candidatus Acetothermia bacterium]|nr:PHP domain-containing protein [Candidatus Acetothermia bacterium]